MQQMMQRLLTRMDAWRKEMNANQESAGADRKADCEALNKMSASIKSNQDLLAKMKARIKTNRETDRKERKAERMADQEDLKMMM
jgi:hypothetical protein